MSVLVSVAAIQWLLPANSSWGREIGRKTRIHASQRIEYKIQLTLELVHHARFIAGHGGTHIEQVGELTGGGELEEGQRCAIDGEKNTAGHDHDLDALETHIHDIVNLIWFQVGGRQLTRD